MVDHVCSSLPACGISHVLHSSDSALSTADDMVRKMMRLYGCELTVIGLLSQLHGSALTPNIA